MRFDVTSYYQRHSGAFRTGTALSRFGFWVVLIAAVISGLSAAAYAADVPYLGFGSGLQSLPSWFVNESALVSNSLFPGSGTIPLSSDNVITVNYDSAAPGAINPWNVLGGLSESENVSGNKVLLINGNIEMKMYGGYSYDGNATYNTVDIQDGKVEETVFGGKSWNGNATNNAVTVSSGDLLGVIFGGYSSDGYATGNTVDISGGSVYAEVYGGLSENGDASYNTATISDGDIYSSINGGYSWMGSATNNTVYIGGGNITVLGEVRGGRSIADAVTNNAVIISSGVINGTVYGGISNYGDAAGNTVDINGDMITITNEVYGGWSQDGNATNNTVTVSDGYIESPVYGGWSQDGNATNNVVVISGGGYLNHNSEWHSVFGGRSEYGDVTNNTVIISGGFVAGTVFGGYSRDGDVIGNTVDVRSGDMHEGVYGGLSENGDSSYNTLTISDSDIFSNISGGMTYQGDAMYNSIVIDGVQNYNMVTGASAMSQDDDQGKASHNTVTIKNSTLSGVLGGQGQNGANYNTVTISDSYVQYVTGGSAMYGSASHNTVDINGGTISGNIQGSFCASGSSTYNTVTISGNIDLTDADIMGGANYGAGDTFTGNTLNFKSSGITAREVRNFQYYNFYLPQGTAANDTMLTLTSSAVDLGKSTVGVFLQGDTSLQTGDRVALFEGPANLTASPLNNRSTAWLGAFINYDFDIYTEDNYLWAELASGKAAEQSNVLTDGRLVPLTFLNQGADLAASIEYLEVSGDRRFNTFALMSGGSSTYDLGMGADIDLDGFSMLAGVMWDVPVNKNSLIMSAFFEAGWGSYDTKRYFSGSNTVRGSGDTDYYGGGLHMRYKWNNDAPGGLYAEASLRVGYATSDYHTNDLAVSNLRYDSGSTYYGAHLGLGYVLHLNDKTRLEATSKFLWTHLDSDEAITSAGDQISFDSVNSHRWRTGFRMYHDLGSANSLTLYYGAAYEYEFSGDADAMVRGYGTNGSSLSGNSGIGELGVIFRPSKSNDRMLMRLGVQGYVGAREGVSGILKLQYAF